MAQKKKKIENSNVQHKKMLSKKYIGSASSSSVPQGQEARILDIDAILSKQFKSKSNAVFSSKTLRNYMVKECIRSKKEQGLAQFATRYASITDHLAFKQYIHETYNNPEYMNVLSQDGTGICDFLELSWELSLSSVDVYTMLRLFNLKLKECEIIDDTILQQLARKIPILIKKHLTPSQGVSYAEEELQASFEHLLLTRFTSSLNQFNKDPEAFISLLSQELANQARESIIQSYLAFDNQRYFQKRLQGQIISLVQTIVDRTLWNVKSHEGITNSFIGMADCIISLGAKGVIDDMDDLDSLLWSLTYRFIYFLDVFGGALPKAFYDHLEVTFDSGEIFFIELDEQDAGIRAKREYLRKAIIKGKTKALAFEKGLIAQFPSS